MLELGGELDLAEKSLSGEHGAELGADDLEGDGTGVLQVPGAVYDPHPAVPDLSLDRIAVAEGALQLVEQLEHWMNSGVWDYSIRRRGRGRPASAARLEKTLERRVAAQPGEVWPAVNVP